MDEDTGVVLEILSSRNAFLPQDHPWERMQDPLRIYELSETMISKLIKKYSPVRCIGISGQMHGILYIDSAGKALSPLYTWQDQRSALPFREGKSYTEYLASLSRGSIAPGYGLATYFYHASTGSVPSGTAAICTIGDYLAMGLCRSSKAVIHTTNACGFGFFDVPGRVFDTAALEAGGIDPSILPDISAGSETLGETPEGIPVSVAIGDNQASFLGALGDSGSDILINIGTGSQISFVCGNIKNYRGLELRPFFEDRFLLVGASLCGGRAYALLENFFREVLKMAGYSHESPLYPFMDSLVSAGENKNPLLVNTLFEGTREDPSLRGWIQNISESNFTPANLAAGFLEGIACELYRLYQPVLEYKKHERLVGSGNGVRKNRPLQQILSKKFCMPLEVPLYTEEAASGAAFFALLCTGYLKDISQTRNLIRYKKTEEIRKSEVP
jgi:sedoheptulokinase